MDKIELTPKKFSDYEKIIKPELAEEIKELAKKLKGIRVSNINATPVGGGVAEILKSLVPLMRSVGIDANWYVMPPSKKFFGITKQIHNALQGKKYNLSHSAKDFYLKHNEKTAKLMADIKTDIWVVHDPQPTATRAFFPKKKAFISRIHIDTTDPNLEVLKFMYSFWRKYNYLVFSLEEFVPKSLKKRNVAVFKPAIDPLSPKNKPCSLTVAKSIIQEFGVDPTKPLLAQVFRFDPWKNPEGSIRAYYLAKNKIPNLQLALVGLMIAKDDPEAERVFKAVKKHAEGDPDIFLFSDPGQIGDFSIDLFVSVFQTAADVIIHKAIREGFGLVVTEAMWKGKPVVGGNVGGIKKQIKDGISGFLVNTEEEAAERIIELLSSRSLRNKIGREAKESVRENFLMPRLLRDYLRLFNKLV